MNQPIRVRIAPSPTGYLHLGGARTALFNYLLAKKTGGQFILRIEDTDQKRFVPGSIEKLMEDIKWLGVEWDEGPDIGGPYGPYLQSQRREIYQQYARQLVESGHAYYCFCTPQRLQQVREEKQKRKESLHYDGTCRQLSMAEAEERIARGEKHVVRFKTPREGTATVIDMLRGPIAIDNREIDDYVLVKSDGLALYHLAVVVDDHLMKITHVIRGSEWLSTFPLHGLIYQAFGWQQPEWIHLSVFLKPSGKGKMSKRESADLIKDGHSIFIKDMEDLGYLPEAVVNWISLMGWSYDDHTEFFTLNDLVDKISIDKFNPSPAAINFSKLDYFNGSYIRNLSTEDLAQRVKPYFEKKGLRPDADTLHKIIPLIQERMVTLDEGPELSEYLFMENVTPNPKDLVIKPLSIEETLGVAHDVLKILKAQANMRPENVEPPMRQLVEERGLNIRQVFGFLRVAITGQTVSLPLFESMEIIGKEKVVERIEAAISILGTIQ